MLGIRNRRLMGKMAREAGVTNRKQGAAESGIGHVYWKKKAWVGRPVVVRAGSRWWQGLDGCELVCTPVECARMAKSSVGIREDRWEDGWSQIGGQKRQSEKRGEGA